MGEPRGVFGNDTGFCIRRGPDTVRAPDLALLRRERVPDPLPPRFDQAPDLAIEIVSPHDRWSEIEAKARDWLSAGTAEVWLVDPDRASIQILSTGGARVRLEADGVLTSAVLPGFRAQVSAVFAPLCRGA